MRRRLSSQIQTRLSEYPIRETLKDRLRRVQVLNPVDALQYSWQNRDTTEQRMSVGLKHDRGSNALKLWLAERYHESVQIPMTLK